MPLILSDEMKDIYENMKSLGYDMFNINDKFYQDLCTPYTTTNNTDIPLSARKEYIYNNEDSKCQDNCHFSSYIPNYLYVDCTCSIEQVEEKEVKKFSIKTLYESFYDVLKYANFEILKCYNLIFDINIYKFNLGNFIIIFLFVVYIIFLICFIIRGIEPLKNKIKKLASISKEVINNKYHILTNNNIIKRNNNHKKITSTKNKIISKYTKKYNVKKYKMKKNNLKHNLNNLSSYSKASISNLTKKK